MTMDVITFSDAFARPGSDTRQWISLGTVDEDAPNARSVRFEDEDGNPLPTGPLVTVTLQPSGITVVCRVGSFFAGVGEGTWYPIQQKDEVLVALPQGDEMASPVIIARLNQALDTWPNVVAGQDAAGNTFGFWRLRAPFIIESAEAFLIRSAKTGSQIGIDGEGQVILNNGDKNNVFIGSDAISISSGDDVTFLQLNFSENRITAAADQARLEVAASGESILFCPGALNVGTSGMRGKGHAVTVEQVFNLLINWTILLASPSFGSSTLASELTAAGKLLSSVPSAFPMQFDAALSAMLPTLVLPTPLPTPTTNGGGMFGFPLTFGPAGITAALLNPIPSTDPTGFVPGIGRAGFSY